MKISMRHVSGSLGLLILLGACASVEAQARPNVVLAETRVKDLGPLPFDKAINYITLSPTGERLAYCLRHEQKEYLISDGKPGPAYHASSLPVFSPDGRRLVYLAHYKEAESLRTLIVCDGQEGARSYSGCSWNYGYTSPFSPDSRRLAYCAQRPVTGNQARVICDGREIFEGNSTTNTVFSPDSRHLAFVATDRVGGNHFVVCDGQRLPGWEGPGGENIPLFSPDSQRLLYWAGREGRYSFIQAVLQKDKWVVPSGQDKGPTYEGFVAHTWGRAFSPDGNHLAYIARTAGKSVMVLDGKTVGTFDQIGSLRFSPDSKRLAYNAHQGKRQFIVCDGQEGLAFDHIDSPMPYYVFSPDSGHLAYIGWRGIKWQPDGRSYSLREAKWQIVCDGRTSPAVVLPDRRSVWPRMFLPLLPAFSPDSRHLAWFSARGGKQFVVIDGVEGPKHFWVKIPEKPCEVEGKLRYVVGDGKEAWLVEVDWPKDTNWTDGLKPVEP